MSGLDLDAFEARLAVYESNALPDGDEHDDLRVLIAEVHRLRRKLVWIRSSKGHGCLREVGTDRWHRVSAEGTLGRCSPPDHKGK